MNLYRVTAAPEPARERTRARVTNLRPNLKGLWDTLGSGTGYLRRTGPDSYILQIQSADSRGSISYLDSAEVAYITDEVERRKLGALVAPGLDNGFQTELLRSVAYSSGGADAWQEF
jgi:hypothetical protein